MTFRKKFLRKIDMVALSSLGKLNWDLLFRFPTD